MLGAIQKLIHPAANPRFSVEQMEDMAHGWCLKGGGGGGGTTTVQEADPWEGQQPYLTGLPGEGAFSGVDVPGLFPEAARLYEDNPLAFFGDQTFAGFAPETEAALGLQTNRALQGSQLNQGAQGLAQNTIGGDYLYSNPANQTFANAAQGNMTNDQLGGLQDTASGQYLDAEQNPFLAGQSQKLLSQVLPQITSQYAGMGRQNSGMAARAASEGATDALGGLWMQNYNRERQNQVGAQNALAGFGETGLNRQLSGAASLGDIYGSERSNQMQAMGAAPALSETDYGDIARLQEVGGVREDLSQQGINEAMQRFQFENMAPWDQLGLYNQMIQGTYGGSTQTTQQQPRRSVGQGLLGGAVAGGGLGYLGGEALGLTSGQGAAYGAGAGGLAGLFM